MAKLSELCINVPYQVTENVLRANVLMAREKRMQRLCNEENIFNVCMNHRPQRKYRNRVSSEKAGSCNGTYITDIRFSGSYIHVATKKRNIF